jgi:hypothetical protein
MAEVYSERVAEPKLFCKQVIPKRKMLCRIHTTHVLCLDFPFTDDFECSSSNVIRK